MSSTDTIKDLKLQLYKQTGQTPNDQLLYRELGGSLLDGDSTLFDARIEKNNADQVSNSTHLRGDVRACGCRNVAFAATDPHCPVRIQRDAQVRRAADSGSGAWIH